MRKCIVLAIVISIILTGCAEPQALTLSRTSDIYEWVSPDGVHYWRGLYSLSPRYNCNGELVIDHESSLTFDKISAMNLPFGANVDTVDPVIGAQPSKVYYSLLDKSVFKKEIRLIGNESSSIEDGMIYTIGTCIDEDGVPCEVLYIHRPSDLMWVAASITYKDGQYILYTFFDENGLTIYDK